MGTSSRVSSYTSSNVFSLEKAIDFGFPSKSIKQGQVTTLPAKGEKNTKDADTNLKDELVDLLGKNVVTQEDGYDEVISNLKVSDLHSAEWREVIQACPEKSEKGWKTIYDLVKTILDQLTQTEQELKIDLNKPLKEQDPLNELNELANKKRKRTSNLKDHSRPIRRIHQGRYGVSGPALTKDHSGIKIIHRIQRTQYAVFKIWNQYNILEDIKRGPYSKKSQYAVKMDDPNITMEEYIMLEEQKARRHGKVYNWETATYGKIWDNEGVHNLGSVETEFPAIIFNDTLTSEAALSCEPTVSSLYNDEIDFRISFDETADEDYMVIFDKNSFSYKIISVNDLKTDSENDNDKVNMPLLPSPEPTVSYFDDLDYFKDFENEFLAIVYNNAQTSKSDLLTKPISNPQHIDEFNLKDETSLSECDEEEQNIFNFNDIFPFNVIYPDELKMDTDNDNDKVDIEHSSGNLSVKPLPDVINTDVDAYAHGSNKLLETSHDTSNKFFKTSKTELLS
ncbi:hypothetical protein Tco_0343769 [Tanacetum coccineum]